jgi:hypothetical protein
MDRIDPLARHLQNSSETTQLSLVVLDTHGRWAMHGVVRRYEGASALGDAMLENEEDVRQLLSSVNGFVAYYAVRSADSVATITICRNESGTTESTRRAAEWVKERNISIGSGSTPQVTEGEVFIQIV